MLLRGALAFALCLDVEVLASSIQLSFSHSFIQQTFANPTPIPPLTPSQQCPGQVQPDSQDTAGPQRHSLQGPSHGMSPLPPFSPLRLCQLPRPTTPSPPQLRRVSTAPAPPGASRLLAVLRAQGSGLAHLSDASLSIHIFSVTVIAAIVKFRRIVYCSYAIRSSIFVYHRPATCKAHRDVWTL